MHGSAPFYPKPATRCKSINLARMAVRHTVLTRSKSDLDSLTKTVLYGQLMKKDQSDAIQELKRKLLSRPPKAVVGRGRRSRLFWWMFNAADELRPILEHASFADVAADLPDIEDVLDGFGKRPNAKRLRKTWSDVCKAKGWIEDKAKPKPETTKPGPQGRDQARPDSSQTQPTPTPDDDDDDDDFIMTAGDGTVLNPRKR